MPFLTFCHFAAALDATTRGLKVACIERGDFASETSSRSTKLIWAGIRYLATSAAGLLSKNLFIDPVATVKDFWGEFMMVVGCHRERRYMLEKQKVRVVNGARSGERSEPQRSNWS